MNTRSIRAVQGLAVVAFLAGGLGGCVYDPYYAYSYPNDYTYPYSYPYSYPYYYPYRYYGYPSYVGPPVSLNFGFGYYHHGGHDGYHGGHHGWSGHGGGWGHHGGGHGHGGH
ncbi:hypothetical protein [Massilia sp.]|uniref:hypothetical protein n=1 Tax=Massilia sp. TaxID=1882437 RepID=UPI0028AF024C|nr:hypothetical protein [Massilia sp.]